MLKRMFPAFLVAFVFCGLAQAVDVKELPNPLQHLKVGQWVTYRLLDDVEQRQTVMSVTEIDGDTEFVVKYETLDAAVDIPDMTEKHSVRQLTEAFLERLEESSVVMNRTRVTAGDDEYDVIMVEMTDEEDGVLRIYLSERVPITGLVKMEDDDEEDGVILEILGFGE